MQVTVIRGDNAVLVDGKYHWVECKLVPAYVQIYQWQGERAEDGTLTGQGHIEFVNDGRDAHSFMPNEPFTNGERIKFLVDAWYQAEKVEQEKAAANAKAKEEAQAAAKRLR